MIADPAFWLAVLLWLAILVIALGLCVAAALGDEQSEAAMEQARRDAMTRASEDSIEFDGGWSRR